MTAITQNGQDAFRRCLQSDTLLLMEGALGERLKREYGLITNGPAGMAGLIKTVEGQTALRTLWKEYATVAAKHNMPFLATTPTRRANRSRVEEAQLSEQILAENVAFLSSVRNDCQGLFFVGGMVGSTGNAYTAEGCLPFADALVFHRWEVQLFSQTNIGFLYAALFPTLDEARAIAMLASQYHLPCLLSFTLQDDGRLIDGTPLADAITRIDASVPTPPLLYMSNCVHPTIIAKALDQPFNQVPIVRQRFSGLQANTSALPYRELDASPVLYSSPPDELAQGMLTLKRQYGFRLFGGCCGTDARHLEAMATLLSDGR